MTDVVGFANRLFNVGWYTEIRLRNGCLPELTVQASVSLRRRQRVGWVPRRACVGVIPKRNRRRYSAKIS